MSLGVFVHWVLGNAKLVVEKWSFNKTTKKQTGCHAHLDTHKRRERDR